MRLLLPVILLLLASWAEDRAGDANTPGLPSEVANTADASPAPACPTGQSPVVDSNLSVPGQPELDG